MSTTVENTTPPPTAQEQALTAKQVELAEFQLAELRKQSAKQDDFAKQIGPLLEIQAAEAERQAARSKALEPIEDRTRRIQDEVLRIQIEDLKRGGAATPEQQALIDQAANEALKAGSTDIERFRSESLEALREELAPALGLRPSDTAILDRGGRVAAEALRQGGQLSSNLRSAAASGKVNIGLAGSQLTQAAGLGLANVTEATRQFQENLRQQAFANRLAVSGQQANIGLGLAGSPGGTLQSALNPLVQSRLANSIQTTSGLGFGTIATGLGGAGGLLTGLAAVSSRDFKTDKTPINDDEILKRVARLAVEKWRYKKGLGLASDAEHIGPYAEDFRDEFGVGDGRTIEIVDAIGIGLAATKALAKKVKNIEAGLGLAKVA